MTEDAAFFSFSIFFSAAIGFLIGDVFGDTVRHRKCLEQANDDLRDQLRQELSHQRGVIHDIHRRIVALSRKPDHSE